MEDSPPSLRDLLGSDLVTDATRAVLRERLNATPAPGPRFFDVRDFETLSALCAALAPSAVVPGFFVPDKIDGRLADGTGNGWRYAALPPDGEAYRRGLRALDGRARVRFGRGFADIGVEQRNEMLASVKNDGVEPEDGLDLGLFVEEICAESAEVFYSHPLAQEEIGYIGFADAKGWYDIGLNQHRPLDPHPTEAREAPPADPVPAPPMRRFPTNEVVDAVVIGTGAGGAPVLARLAQAGLRVVALEAGPFFDHRRFPTDEAAQTGLFWLDERLSAGETPLAFGNNNSGCGVGGSTVHFTAYVPRPHPGAFRLRTTQGVGRDWCLSYDDLIPYYDEAEAFLGVSGPASYPWDEGRGYPLPPLPLNGAAELMQRGCAALGLRTSPAPNAALSRRYYRDGIGWREACTNRGFCQAGCSVGAKGSMDVTYIPLAIHHGAEVRDRCFVTAFEFGAQKRISAVVYVQDGVTKKQPCRNVFLCGGAIETPRLLLANGLANTSGQVGKNFMAHPGVQVWGVFDEAIYPHKGIPASLISEDLYRPQQRHGVDFSCGYLLQSIGVMPITYASQLARGQKIGGKELAWWMQRYNHTAGINIHGECLPHEHNFVALSGETDARGLPKPIVYFTQGDNERRISTHGEQLMREIWAQAGAREMWTFQRSAHIIGTCRMGTSPEDSVVNGDCRSFDIENLYIVDNSIFPSSLSVNPLLTIVALALRASDRFLNKS